jgi:hypothetical protein
MNLVFGIPLEGLHGHLRMAFMYNVGVVGGAFCYWVLDAHSVVVGMSGGCYALIGMHVSNIAMNWHQLKFRIPTLMFLTILVALELTIAFTSKHEDNTSHTAHLGGAIFGLLISTIIGENLVVHRHERVIQILAVTTAAVLAALCLIYMVLNDAPRNLTEDYGWCYVGQVYDPNKYLVPTFESRWQCVQCPSKQCVETVMTTMHRYLVPPSVPPPAGWLPQVALRATAMKNCVNWWVPHEGKFWR